MQEKLNTMTISIDSLRILNQSKPLRDMFEQTTAAGSWKKKADEWFSKRDFEPEFRREFHTYWTEAGHHIREQIDDDTVLISLLRAVLPRYVGPSRILYRGENINRFNHGRIGLCWTEQFETARMFGQGLNATGDGGLLLKCNAPDIAIIAGPSSHSLYLGEGEFTLDISMISVSEEIMRFPTSD